MSVASVIPWGPAKGGPVSAKIGVDDLSRVGEARRAAETIARSCGLDEQARGKLGIVVTEAATNLARHSRDGFMLLRDTGPTGVAGVEMLAVDHGPGMQDLSRYFADGYSTAGSSGAGLGAIRRQASELDVHSRPGQGTVLMARVFATGADRPAPPMLDVGVVCVALDGETACGDAWRVHQDDRRALVLLADGLGHGAKAAEAADVATSVFSTGADRSPKELVLQLHEALRATRGAALAVAEIKRTESGGAIVTYCGVGNTVASLDGAEGSRSFISMNGTAGLALHGVQELALPWAGEQILIMHTDGIATRWRLGAYPDLRQRTPAIVAAVLYRDFARARDDATVLALRLRPVLT